MKKAVLLIKQYIHTVTDLLNRNNKTNYRSEITVFNKQLFLVNVKLQIKTTQKCVAR